ncbi:MAG: TonB-dependent receptor, partial [Bacteroidia bacterium]|nr:TonB-dependent receptor [Bacteroidia bacterium]
DVAETPVSEVLDDLFEDLPVSYRMRGNYIFLTKESNPTQSVTKAPIPSQAAQDRKTASGKVCELSGEPLIGVSVVIKGTSRGTVTDIDGNFSIDAEEGSILEISCIGFKGIEVPARFDSPMEIYISEDTEMIEETVVIGYGVQKKSDLTGAVASVKDTDLSNRSTSDAAAALQGKAAGVQILNFSGAPGSEASIRVRGYSSNSGNIGPLLIVDGLKVDNISYLDPSMIESMEVLKDAASAAIYGSQAGNGVVLITTKSGSSSKGEAHVTYDMKFTRQSLGKKAEVFNAADFINYKRASGLPIDSMLEAYNYNGQDTDWFDVLFGPSYSPQHAVTFRGGNDKGSLFASINYLNNDGIVVGDKDVYKRLSAQINADYKLFKWLSISTNTSLERNSSKSVGEQSAKRTVLFAALTMDPLTPTHYKTIEECTDAVQQAYAAGKNILIDPSNGMYYATSAYCADDNGNPLLQKDRVDTSNNRINIRGTLNLNLTPFSGFVFTSRFGYRIGLSTSHSYSTPYYCNSTTYSDTYDISANSTTNWYYQWENFANYNKNFGKHSIGAMAGMSYVENNSDNVSASATGVDILTGYEKNFQYLHYVNNNPGTTKNIDNTPSRSVNMSYYGRITYSYDNRYSLQSNFRADAYDSSKLSKQNRWGYFPSFSAGWTVSNEPFFKDKIDRNAISFLKLRASWGRNGNVDVLSGYPYSTAISYNSEFYQYDIHSVEQTYGSKPDGLANPNLTWETSEQVDLGLDARFLNSRLTLGVDWFNKQTKDLLVNISPVPEIGVKSTTVNAGKVKNSGLEVELTWKDNIGDLGYSINGNFSTVHNTVTYLDPSISRIEGSNNGVSGTNNPVSSCFEVGYPIWYFRAYKFSHTDPSTGEAMYINAEGETVNSGALSDGDMQYIGSAIPDLTYGLTINLDYKAFDFSIYGTGISGGQIFNVFYRADTPLRNSLRYYYDNAWTASNHSGSMPDPKLVANDWHFWGSSASMFSSDYFKIKQIQLGYTLPKDILKKVLISNFRAFVSFDDFFTFTKYPGFDPETATTSTSARMGYDAGSYPTTRKVIFGVNITF